VVLSRLVSGVVLEVSYVVLSVGKQNVNMAVCKLPVFEAAIHDLILWREEQTETMRAILSPRTLVDAAVWKFAETGSFPLSVLKVALVDFPIREDELALPILLALRYATFIYNVGHVNEIGLGLLQEVHPVARNSCSQNMRYDEISTIRVLRESSGTSCGSVIQKLFLLKILRVKHLLVLDLESFLIVDLRQHAVSQCGP